MVYYKPLQSQLSCLKPYNNMFSKYNIIYTIRRELSLDFIYKETFNKIRKKSYFNKFQISLRLNYIPLKFSKF